MDFQQLIESITPEIYENLKRAVEIGKWPDGSQLTQEQRENSLQAIIAYDARHKSEEERVGYVPPKNDCDKDGGSFETDDPNKEQPMKWQG